MRAARVAALLAVAAAVAPAARAGEEMLTVRRGHAFTPARRTPTDALVASLALPPGFRIARFADGLRGVRMLAVGDDGTVYATRPAAGDVVALADRDGDGRAEERRTAAADLPGVHGVAVHGRTLLLATVREVYAVALDGDRTPRRLFAGLPPGGNHPNRTLALGPDGRLYVSVGSTCNCCVEDSRESATILRAAPDGSARRVFARGLRNTIGFGWHPKTHAMWGMDHGTDWLGDDAPPEELNRLEAGHDYGWPDLWGANQPVPGLPAGVDAAAHAARATPPVLGYTAHAAPIAMVFYDGAQFPPEYRGDAFVAMHGSWNREPPAGYEVVRIRFRDGAPERFEPFLRGFLRREDGRWTTFGRPCGLAVARDGALLVGDDANGVVYRVAYEK
ncbi:MAG TPA: PQQ-dependent sugar dehydrogenase [Candidatus Binatia bacterium]|nr:PQQ-dependent sugar dehydrogenase [Candidatus Binatia bacterium]